MIQVRLTLGDSNELLFGVASDSECQYRYLEDVSEFRDSVSAPGSFTIGTEETPSVTIKLFNRNNETYQIVGPLRRVPVEVLENGAAIFRGLIINQKLGATMILEAQS